MPATSTPLHRSFLLAALCGAFLALPLRLAAQGAASAPAAPPASAAAAPSRGEPAAACEEAVRALLATKGTTVADLKFNGQPTPQKRLSNDEQLVLRGGGSWRANAGGARTFDYTCNVDPRSGEAVGMVMRDTTPASAKAAPPSAPLEPDLSQLSPTVCESAVAAVLKKRWPRVSDVSFESQTRSLKQTTPTTAELHGRGRALTEQGAPHRLFGFDCVFDTRDGRLLGSRLSG